MRGSRNFESARQMLEEHLGYKEISQATYDTLIEYTQIRYQQFASEGIEYFSYQREWGRQGVFRDTNTGQFMGYDDVADRIDQFNSW